MGKANRLKGNKRYAALLWILMFAMLFAWMSSMLAQPVQAKSVRAAQVIEVKGDVTYTKSGGSKAHRVYLDLNLNQGDSISTGASSYVVLRIEDREDELTIGENAEVYIADLLEEAGGKKSKFKTWAGSMWTKVKSLVSSEDEFEVETPTAVMGVRGTQFMTVVDPYTGRMKTFLAAGVLQAETVSPGSPFVTIYPSQQIDLGSRTEFSDLRTRVDYIDLKSIVELASPKVLEAFIKNIPDIQRENEEIKRQLQEQFNQGIQKPDELSNLLYLSQDDLDKVKQNFDSFLPNLVREAVDGKKVDQRLIDEVNRRIDEPGKKIDLTTPAPSFDRTAGLDPDIERIKKEAGNRALTDHVLERRRMEQDKEKLSSLLAKLQEDMKRVQDANRASEAAAAQKASDALQKQMTDAERREFLEKQRKNEDQNRSDVHTPPSGGGGSSYDSDPVAVQPNPPKPVVSVKQNGGAVNGVVHLDLEMQNFTDKEPFYAVQAHLVYHQVELNYAQGPSFQNAHGAVFKELQAAETLTQHSGGVQSELIYAASQYESPSGQPGNIRLNGSRLLARIPLQVTNTAAGTAHAELVYVKVVNKEGVTVYEMKSPQPVTVITK